MWQWYHSRSPPQVFCYLRGKTLQTQRHGPLVYLEDKFPSYKRVTTTAKEYIHIAGDKYKNRIFEKAFCISDNDNKIMKHAEREWEEKRDNEKQRIEYFMCYTFVSQTRIVLSVLPTEIKMLLSLDQTKSVTLPSWPCSVYRVKGSVVICVPYM